MDRALRMVCPSTEDLIRFVYQEAASNDELQQIKNHIFACEKCSAEVTSIQTLDEALAKIIHAKPSEVSGEMCPDAMSLAAYAGASLASEERARVERHLASCQSCLDDLIAAHGLANTASLYRKTPAHLLNKAIRLGVLSTEPGSTSESAGVLEKIRRWFEPLVSRPRWAFIGAGACAIVLAVFMAHQIYQRESDLDPSAGPAINKLTQHDGDTTRPAEDIAAEGKLDLSGDLKRALIDHDPKNITPSQSPLLVIIEKKAPQMPVDKIKKVEIKQNLLIAIASVSDLAGQIKLQLYKDGLLVIGADS